MQSTTEAALVEMDDGKKSSVLYEVINKRIEVEEKLIINQGGGLLPAWVPLLLS